ncbi:hypothetical protein KKG45_10300 [bacterium]|nr:hypothetical protein [bacterium]MBU1073627.1 hypothetical protein [bacterium]MBU1676070.1 hypothetical protein [bacterium]
MSRPGKITGAFIRTILGLAILMTPSQLFALTYAIDGLDDDREEWHGPGDPEGGDRYHGDLNILDPEGLLRGGADDTDPRDPRGSVPLIRLIPLGDGYLMIIGSGDAPGAYPILLSR